LRPGYRALPLCGWPPHRPLGLGRWGARPRSRLGYLLSTRLSGVFHLGADIPRLFYGALAGGPEMPGHPQPLVYRNRKGGKSMKRFVIATHGNFAAGILDSLELIMGKQENFEAFCAYCDGENDIKERVRRLIESKKSDEDLIVVTDLFRGSVNNE